MTRATDAYTELLEAMEDYRPKCRDDIRFISDDYRAAELAPTCRRCPVFPECETYAQIAKPKGGVWAGKRW